MVHSSICFKLFICFFFLFGFSLAIVCPENSSSKSSVKILRRLHEKCGGWCGEDGICEEGLACYTPTCRGFMCHIRGVAHTGVCLQQVPVTNCSGTANGGCPEGTQCTPLLPQAKPSNSNSKPQQPQQPQPHRQDSNSSLSSSSPPPSTGPVRGGSSSSRNSLESAIAVCVPLPSSTTTSSQQQQQQKEKEPEQDSHHHHSHNHNHNH